MYPECDFVLIAQLVNSHRAAKNGTWAINLLKVLELDFEKTKILLGLHSDLQIHS